jgi:protoporphyrinogen oxidase
LSDLDLEKEIQWVETKTGFFTDGKLHSVSNTLEFLKFPSLGLIDKLRLGATIFYASKVKNWERLETILVADWLQRLSGRRTCERIWKPLLRAKLGENYKRSSAAFIWATIARMYGARRTGLKKEMFGYVPGGYARILKQFGEVLEKTGVDIKMGCGVSQVTRTNGRLQVQTSNGPEQTFDNVIVTLPSQLAARICPGLSNEEREKLDNIEYQGIICASLLLKKPLAKFYVTNITDSRIPFTAVIEMSALVDRLQFSGHSLVYLPKYVAQDDPAFSMSDEEIQEHFVTALASMYPDFSPSDLLSFRISRVPHVFPVPTLNYSKRLPSVETSVPGLHILNSAHIVNGTLNVNETVQLAEKAVPQLLAGNRGR